MTVPLTSPPVLDLSCRLHHVVWRKGRDTPLVANLHAVQWLLSTNAISQVPKPYMNLHHRHLGLWTPFYSNTA